MQLHNDLISPVEKGGFAGARPSTPSDEEEAAGAPSADDEEGTVGGSDGPRLKIVRTAARATAEPDADATAIVNAPGHGKCIVDAMNGVDKTLLNLFFSYLVAHPEEATAPGPEPVGVGSEEPAGSGSATSGDEDGAPAEEGGAAGEPEPPSTLSDEEDAAGAPSGDDEEGTVGGSDGVPEEGEPDYSENYQPVPMREIQSEHFGL